MDHPEGAGSQRADRVDFDRRVLVEFRGAQISSDGGLLVMRELDDALGLSNLASVALREIRRGKNTIHRLGDLFQQSVFGRLVGYEDVNDADRLALDPVMRQVMGGCCTSRPRHHLPTGQGRRHRRNGAGYSRCHPPPSSASIMRVTAIWTQTERKRQGRSTCRAEKRRRLARTRRLLGLIRPVPEACATADAARGEKRLS